MATRYALSRSDREALGKGCTVQILSGRPVLDLDLELQDEIAWRQDAVRAQDGRVPPP
ncbi:hypothetical protein [Streptomyces sp. NPDC005799]|uniref:hypothetical protein n=1 Tax=Streptomyces sp. NPDC005799 TaxID=3154678 RepID=UPI00340A8AC8